LFDLSGTVQSTLDRIRSPSGSREVSTGFRLRGFQMLHHLFGPISSSNTSRRSAGAFAVMLVVVGSSHPARAASSDDVDRLIGAVSAQAVKLRKCYENRLDFDWTLSCKTRGEIIESAKRGCWAAETDLRTAIIKSAKPEQRASIASLTAGVLDAVRRRLEATISDNARREIPFDCLVSPASD
jgi:hypothetical protein